jgi:hypothetical protein
MAPPSLKTGVHRYIPDSVSSYGICLPIPIQGAENVLDAFFPLAFT